MTFDLRVQEAQIYVNGIGHNVPGYNPAPEDGQTGWSTMFALTRALQHLLGISTLSDNFGTGTLSALTAQFPVIDENTPTADLLSTPSKIVGILQAALWCKGYWSAPTFGQWNPDTGNSLASINERIGLPSARSVTPKVFKSILTMDAYVVVGSGTAATREVQQWLNSRYLNRSAFYVIPTDGYYSRDVQRGLMYAIQYELGMSDSVANGNFGPSTQSGLQTYGAFGVGFVDTSKKLCRLFQAALRFNGYPSTPFSGAFDSSTSSATSSFQSFAELAATGAANFQTWASLLVSTGDTSRATLAADTSTPLTSGKAAALYSAGYRTVGRYLTVESKRYKAGELSTIFGAGLSTFPIYQQYNNTISAFTYSLGRDQGVAAVKRARQLGFASGTIIYFAVDYDATGDEIVAAIIPFFQGVRDGVATSSRLVYQVGIYGTRNVCATVSAAGLAVSSFVSGMSTGWSGNLGFPLPSNWAYDQIQTTTVGSGSSAVEVDRNVRRTGAPALVSANVERTPLVWAGGTPSFDELTYWRWALLQYLADSARTSTVPHLAMNDMILMRLQLPVYWLDPANPTAAGAFWTFAYTPATWTWAPAGRDDDYFAAYGNFEPSVEEADFALPAAGAVGDLAHFAASTRGYIKWGVPGTGDAAALGDYGAWGLDLVSLWTQNYEPARLAEPGSELNVLDWTKLNLGTALDSHFGAADLKADMAAFLVARQIVAEPDRPLSDIMRVLFNNIEDSPNYLRLTFMSERFGSSSAAEQVAESMFNQPWLFDGAIEAMLPGRYPGTLSGEEGYPNPSQAALDVELQQFATGFAYAVEHV
jgi:peptidoglycan hydrolase-like protein with peptidoglycan-binding domain